MTAAVDYNTTSQNSSQRPKNLVIHNIANDCSLSISVQTLKFKYCVRVVWKLRI